MTAVHPAAGDTVTEAFFRLAEFGHASGARDIGSLPGCWEARIGDTWWAAANGSGETRHTSTGIEVPPFAWYVERDGFPVGYVTAREGLLLIATEDELIDACRRATRRLQAAARRAAR